MHKPTLRTLCGVAMSTTMYYVASMPLVGLHFGLEYIVLSIACSLFGVWGAFIGTVGCIILRSNLKTILFNFIIGLGCGVVFKKTETIWIRTLAMIIFVGIGVLGVGGVIDYYRFNMPADYVFYYNLGAFQMISLMMFFGIKIVRRIHV